MKKRNLVLGLIALLVVIAGTWGVLGIRAGASAPTASSVNARVILRRNKFDPPLSSSFFFQQLTRSKVLSHVCCARQQIVRLPHPAAARLHLDTLWWTAGAETSERGIYCREIRARSSRLPSLPQASRSYDLPPSNASTRSLRMPNEQGLRGPYPKAYGLSDSGAAVTSGKRRRTCST